MRFLILFVLVCFCSCQEIDIVSGGKEPAKSIDIKEFISMYGSNSSCVIDDNYTLYGTVTSSDSSSNFYFSFIVEDKTAAIEVMCGFYDIYTTYKVGYELSIDTRGLTFGRGKDGVYRLGLDGSSVRDIEYFGHRAIAEKYISVVNKQSNVPVREKQIFELTDADVARMVRIKNLKFCPEGDFSWAPSNDNGSWNQGKIKFVDKNKDTVLVVTSSYASFASLSVPTQSVDITGIIFKNDMYDQHGFYFKINDEQSVVPNE